MQHKPAALPSELHSECGRNYSDRRHHSDHVHNDRDGNRNIHVRGQHAWGGRNGHSISANYGAVKSL